MKSKPTYKELEKIIQKLEKRSDNYRYEKNKIKKLYKDLEVKFSNQKQDLTKEISKLDVEIIETVEAENIQKVLFTISNATRIVETIDDLYKIIHKQVMTLMDARNFMVALIYDKKKNLYTFPYYVDQDKNQSDLVKSKDTVIKITKGFIHYITKTGKPVLADKKTIYKMYEERDEIEFVGIDLWRRSYRCCRNTKLY
jgi:hypothetical protein